MTKKKKKTPPRERPPGEPKKKLGLYVPVRLIDSLRERADLENGTITAVLIEAIEEYFKTYR